MNDTILTTIHIPMLSMRISQPAHSIQSLLKRLHPANIRRLYLLHHYCQLKQSSVEDTRFSCCDQISQALVQLFMHNINRPSLGSLILQSSFRHVQFEVAKHGFPASGQYINLSQQMRQCRFHISHNHIRYQNNFLSRFCCAIKLTCLIICNLLCTFRTFILLYAFPTARRTHK